MNTVIVNIVIKLNKNSMQNEIVPHMYVYVQGSGSVKRFWKEIFLLSKNAFN